MTVNGGRKPKKLKEFPKKLFHQKPLFDHLVVWIFRIRSTQASSKQEFTTLMTLIVAYFPYQSDQKKPGLKNMYYYNNLNFLNISLF